jgi:HEAT repeat protein
MNHELQAALTELQNPDPEIRELALDRIGSLQPNHVFEIIVPFLSDPNPAIRSTAACNLGDIDDERSIPLLIDLVKQDPVEEVRAEALFSLENYRAPEILKCLIDEVHREKKSRRPRQIAAKQLQHYNTDQSREALSILLLQDDDVYVRTFAADSLLKLNHSKLSDVWKQALEDESSYVSEVSNQALVNLHDSNKLPQTG